jgi:hypothetical protein
VLVLIDSIARAHKLKSSRELPSPSPRHLLIDSCPLSRPRPDPTAVTYYNNCTNEVRSTSYTEHPSPLSKKLAGTAFDLFCIDLIPKNYRHRRTLIAAQTTLDSTRLFLELELEFPPPQFYPLRRFRLTSHPNPRTSYFVPDQTLAPLPPPLSKNNQEQLE